VTAHNCAYVVSRAAIGKKEGREESEIEFSWAGETARHVGTVVHRWLQCVANDALQGWDARRVDALKPRFTRELQRRGVPPTELRTSADLVALALKNAIEDDRGRWILGPHPEARSEYRLRTRTPSGPRHFIMDRAFRDSDGQQWVVDYKTSRHEGANLDDFLDRERERYAPQLRGYAQSLAPSRQGLYFPLLRGWRENME
jgi:ATP-dependent exoDNAse (exonuclease V) beta subunit